MKSSTWTNVWETSLEHEGDPRTGVIAEQMFKDNRSEIKRLSEEIHAFAHRLRSEFAPLKKISAGGEIQPRGAGAEKKGRCLWVCREYRRGHKRAGLFAVASSSGTARVIATKRPNYWWE